ncbi:DNA gyrase inhibitor GyrI [Seinonella peptonophila]|uniref:DNA gyrase inhibitor GyrI n=1 Tax=Seinonella peptonophila TaxID=112248 RepID=A0A1M5ABI5_9BACL|nr:GyrI-like domain-containing protein [Seinonella peptonophila]SHF27514.1 DNA gyrase inhibitor GyrI [Seinonella peptonophila]
MNIIVETLPKYRIAFVRQWGPYGSANKKAMEKLKKWAKEEDLLESSTIIFGIPQDNPEITLPENCRYDACIVIAKDYHLDGSVLEGELAGGEYLIYKVKHTGEDIQNAWANIFSFIHNKGFEIEHKPILERYTGDMVSKGYCELCIPVRPL